MICKVENLNINYEIIGEGIPIVMIHGYYADHRLMKGCMEPIFENISGYKRIYFDLPGMGKSTYLNFVDSSDAFLDVVIKFIEKIIPNERFLLVGQSYGGYISLGLIHKLQEQISGIMLICPCIEPDIKQRLLPNHTVLKRDYKLLAKLSPSEFKIMEENIVIQEEKVWNRYKNEILEGIKLYNKDGLNFVKDNNYSFSFDIKNMKEKFKGQALFLLGKQDSVVGYKDCFSILDNFERASFVILDGCGHNLQIEQEKTFNNLTKKWLQCF